MKIEKPMPEVNVHDEAEDEAIEGTEEGEESAEMEEQALEEAPGDEYEGDTLVIDAPALPEDAATEQVVPPARAFEIMRLTQEEQTRANEEQERRKYYK